MYLYHWDKETKEFLGVSPARIDPLESCKKNETIYLQGSPFTTLVQVPYFEKNEIPVWDGKTWIIEKDYRGNVVYDKKTAEAFIITKIGDLPEGYTNEKPNEFAEWKDEKWEISLKKAINKKISELSSFKNQKKGEDVFWKGIRIPTDSDHWLELYRKKIWLKEYGSASNSPWKIDDNTWIELDSENVLEIFEAIETHNSNCDLNEFRHSKAIGGLKSVEDVKNYDFTKEW